MSRLPPDPKYAALPEQVVRALLRLYGARSILAVRAYQILSDALPPKFLQGLRVHPRDSDFNPTPLADDPDHVVSVKRVPNSDFHYAGCQVCNARPKETLYLKLGITVLNLCDTCRLSLIEGLALAGPSYEEEEA